MERRSIKGIRRKIARNHPNTTQSREGFQEIPVWVAARQGQLRLRLRRPRDPAEADLCN